MMETEVFSGISIVLLAGAISFAIFFQPVEADFETIVVPEDYVTIQQAVDSAHPGSRIYVKNGTYCEDLILNKSNLTLLGENKNSSIIDGSRFAVSMEANNIKLSGFTIRNAYVGVQMSPWTHGHIISGNKIQDNDEGINGHYDVWNVTIHNNQIIMNRFVGINLVFYDSIVSHNLVSTTGKGDFKELTSGILIGEGVNNRTISSNNNMIIGNVIKDNFNGISVVKYSEGNVFRHNTFQNNTNHISHPAYLNGTIQENFWSDYFGEDNNGDGIGDTPYILGSNMEDDFPLMSPFNYWSNPIEGDLNKDMKVDIRDLAFAAEAFGSYPGHERWKTQADLYQDDRIDIKDIVLIAKNFGKTPLPSSSCL